MAKKKAKKGNLTIGQIERALIKSNGLVTKAAAILGVTHPAIVQRIKRSPKLQRARDKINETLLDAAENTVHTKFAAEKNLTAAIFFLKTKGKHRGYIEKQEIIGDLDCNIRIEKIERVIIDPNPIEEIQHKSAAPVIIKINDD
jgi:predicted transcriptional regulator